MSKKLRDFRGVATKYNIRCKDGRTIAHGTFEHKNGQKVPLVFQHNHKDANAVLGHAILSNGEDCVYADCFFNDTKSGKSAKALVQHGDIEALSIFANELVENNGISLFFWGFVLVGSPSNLNLNLSFSLALPPFYWRFLQPLF